MIYLYAITEATAERPACLGLEDAEVRLVRASEVAGVCSTHDRIDPRPQPETLWRHEQVVEAAMERGPALPVRFATTYADEVELVASLDREGATLRRRLHGVQGCVELAVRVGALEGDSPEPPPADGREYVEAKLARHLQRRAIVDTTLAPLRELAVRASTDSGSEHEVVCASYLVRSDQVERFAEQVEVLAERNPQLWLSCTGPWPPYSFAGLEEAA